MVIAELAAWVEVATQRDDFFFFQAEDGIRDLTVTGVQTCALPISHCHLHANGPGNPDAAETRRRSEKTGQTLRLVFRRHTGRLHHHHAPTAAGVSRDRKSVV